MSSDKLNSKDSGLVLLLKTILRQYNFFSVVCCYGWQENGLKLRPLVSSFDAVYSKIAKKIIMVSSR